jgi:hypothetical protein
MWDRSTPSCLTYRLYGHHAVSSRGGKEEQGGKCLRVCNVFAFFSLAEFVVKMFKIDKVDRKEATYSI